MGEVSFWFKMLDSLWRRRSVVTTRGNYQDQDYLVTMAKALSTQNHPMNSGADVFVINQPKHRLSEMLLSNPFCFPSSFWLHAAAMEKSCLFQPSDLLFSYRWTFTWLLSILPAPAALLLSIHLRSSALSQPELGRVLQRGAAPLTNRFWSERFGSRLGAVNFVL